MVSKNRLHIYNVKYKFLLYSLLDVFMRLSRIMIFIMMHKILLTLNESLTDTAISVCRTAHCSMGGQLNLCHWLTRWCPMLYRPGSRHTETNLPSSRPPQHLLQPAPTCSVTPKMEKTPQMERRTVLTPYLVSHRMKLNHLTQFIIVHDFFFLKILPNGVNVVSFSYVLWL